MKWNIDKGVGLAGAIAVIGTGAAFVGGLFLSNPLLGWLPDIVHTIIGYAIVVVGLYMIWKMFKKR